MTDEGKSISSLHKELNNKGFKINRLLLTGYLRALTDLKIVKEKPVPPAKIFIPLKAREMDFYMIVGEKARSLFVREEAETVLMYTLIKVLRRAVFTEELAKAGIEGNIPGRPATNQERLEAKKTLTRSGFKIADSSRAYMLDGNENDAQYLQMIESLLTDSHDIGYLIKETKQTKLTL
ncbi:MAG TPA: hypothetical protein VLH13_01675 [Methanomassiliicoccales archaeon]|nr:hypothetical protein [Methanomassiliicoccales archaeon]